eukprot:g13089.t1
MVGPSVDSVGCPPPHATNDGIFPTEKESVPRNLRALVGADRVVVFLRGTPIRPQCTCSRVMVQLLVSYGVSFAFFDVSEHRQQLLRLFENNSDREIGQTDESGHFSSQSNMSGQTKLLEAYGRPQVFIEGEPVGGIIELEELASENRLAPRLLDLDARSGSAERHEEEGGEVVVTVGTPQGAKSPALVASGQPYIRKLTLAADGSVLERWPAWHKNFHDALRASP